MIKVLYLTKYSKKAASSRLRSFQYFPLLEKKNIKVTVSSFFDDAYLDRLYNKQKQRPITILKYYFLRFFVLFTIFRYDKIVIEKELFPYFFSWFERGLSFLGVNYIVDYDDAIFHNYDLSKSKIISLLLKKKIDNVMKYSHCVIAGNSYLANRAINAKANHVVIIPTVIDTEQYEVKLNYKSDPVIIGWIGSPTTFKYVEKILPVLTELIEKYHCKVQIVGAKCNLKLSKNIEFISWTEATEVSSIQKFDIGIMPLDNTPWELGKCSYKLIQYMGCGIPVVASPIGMNKDVVDEGINGFLANNNNEWLLYLEKLIVNESMRNEFGNKGRSKVENSYSLKMKLDELINLMAY